jgi:hypothetical protein
MTTALEPELSTFRWSSKDPPFGGTKHSGYGREHAIETLREHTYTKIVRFPSGLGTIPAWRALDDIFDNMTELS